MGTEHVIESGKAGKLTINGQEYTQNEAGLWDPVEAEDETKKVYESGATRSDPTGKGRWDLMPYEALHRLAERFEYGVERHGERNWEKGQPVSRCYSSALHHIYRYLAGMGDEDHLGAAMWNLVAAATIEARCLSGDLPRELLDAGPHQCD